MRMKEISVILDEEFSSAMFAVSDQNRASARHSFQRRHAFQFEERGEYIDRSMLERMYYMRLIDLAGEMYDMRQLMLIH